MDYQDYQDFDEYGCHLPFLRRLFDKFQIRSVVEFGMGKFSTEFFLTKELRSLVSVEYDHEWLKRYCSGRHHHRCFREEPHLFASHLSEPTDLVFVDGPFGSRAACVQAAFPFARFICIHDRRAYDTGLDPFGIDSLELPPGWFEFEYWAALRPDMTWMTDYLAQPYRQAHGAYPEKCGLLIITSIMAHEEAISLERLLD